MQPKIKNSGFTLIELIIYIGIVSIILVSISYLMIDILGASVSNLAKTEVTQSIRLITTQLIKDVHRSADIQSVEPGRLILILPAGHVLNYSFDQQQKKLVSWIDDNDPIQIYSDDIEVEGEFSDLSFMDKTKTVNVNLSVSYKNPSNNQIYQANTIINLALELHGRR